MAQFGLLFSLLTFSPIGNLILVNYFCQSTVSSLSYYITTSLSVVNPNFIGMEGM